MEVMIVVIEKEVTVFVTALFLTKRLYKKICTSRVVFQKCKEQEQKSCENGTL